MRKLLVLLISIFFGLNAHSQCNAFGMSVSSSTPTSVQLYTAAFFFTPANEANENIWTITDMTGGIVHQVTTSGSFNEQSFMLFSHAVPLTESMNVLLNVTNPVSGVDCEILGTLIWSESQKWHFTGDITGSGFWPELAVEVAEVNGVSCFGDADGSFTLATSGGFPTYEYSINGGPFLITDPTFDNLAAGSYTVVVRDRESEPLTIEVEIPGPEELVLDIQKLDASCNGSDNGQIIATASGGTNINEYRYYNGFEGPFDNGIFTDLAPGVYEIGVLDDNDCFSSVFVTITEPLPVETSSMGSIVASTNPVLPADYNFQEYIYPEPNDQGDCQGIMNATASISEVFLSQTHRHAIGHPLLFTIGERPVYLQVAVTGIGPSPDVQVQGILNGNILGTLCLNGPPVLSSIIDISQANTCEYFSVTIPKSWVKEGLSLNLSAGNETRTLTQSDLKVGPYTELNLVLVNMDFMDYNEEGHFTPIFDNFLNEVASAIPASVVRFGTFPDTIKIPSLAVVNDNEEIVLVSSADMLQDNGISDEGSINSIGLTFIEQLQRTTGDFPNTIYFGNTLNLAPGGWGTDGSFVSFDYTDIFIHELGHALSLPHWEDEYMLANPAADQFSYPYAGEVGDASGRGESWNFIQDIYEFVSPICQDPNGQIGLERSDAMQREISCIETRSNGPGPWDGFGDFSAKAINNFLVGSESEFGEVNDRGNVVPFHLKENNGYPIVTLVNGKRSYSRAASQPQNNYAENYIKLPGEEQLEQDVYLIYGSAHANRPNANIIYEPILYKGTLIPVVDPTDEATFAMLQSIEDADDFSFYDQTRDITLKITYEDGSVLHTLIPFTTLERPTTGAPDENLSAGYFTISVPADHVLCNVELYYRPFLISDADNTELGNINDSSQGINAENYMNDALLLSNYNPDCSFNEVDADGDGFFASNDCDDMNADINPSQTEIPYNGIDDDCNAETLDDDLDQDGYGLAEDCDDMNAEINPGQTELAYNGIDDDCDASTLDDDLDQDGYGVAEDCDDMNADINPGQTELAYNGIDDDCDASTLDDDLDQDGYGVAEDCNDMNADINAGQSEIPYNGLDDDCNMATLDDDLDQDGYALAEDCDDMNADINAGQPEIPYNGLDDDCNMATLDDDLDQDGYVLTEDCDDMNAAINPGQPEIPYNGIDDDCDASTLDDDLDQDGYVLTEDCDDMNGAINPGQPEIAYNGIDDDCNMATLDDDLDQDGYALADDCDDMNADINPDAEDIPNNDIDEDCDGMDLISSIHEISSYTINIYPNPVIDIINIDVSGNLDYRVNLFNLEGKLIKAYVKTNQIKVDSITPGTYLLEIKDQRTGQRVIEKIIITK